MNRAIRRIRHGTPLTISLLLLAIAPAVMGQDAKPQRQRGFPSVRRTRCYLGRRYRH